MDRKIRVSVFVFIIAAIALITIALGWSFYMDAKIMNLCLSLAILFLMLGNTFLMYLTIYKLDSLLEK